MTSTWYARQAVRFGWLWVKIGFWTLIELGRVAGVEMKGLMKLFKWFSIVLVIFAAGCAHGVGGFLERHDEVKPRVTYQPVPTPMGPYQQGVEPQPTNYTKPYYSPGTAWYEESTNPPASGNYVTHTNWVTNTTYAPSPGLVAVLQGAKTVNSMANPTPTAPIVNLAIEGILGGLSLWATWLNRKKNGQLAEKDTVIQAVVKGVEAGTEGADAGIAERVKSAIDAASKQLQVSDPLHQAVVTYTKQ